MTEVNAKLSEINAKYKDAKDTQSKQMKQQEIMQLYKKNDVRPFAAFEQIFITLPIFLIVYHEKGIMVFAMFIIAAAAITVGILGLCFADKLVTLAYVLMGTALVVLGILFIIFSALQMKKSS